MSQCPTCKKEISMSQAFCSNKCKEIYFKEIEIQIPRAFLNRILNVCDEKQRIDEIEAFASRHNFKVELVIEKINQEMVNKGFTNKVLF